MGKWRGDGEDRGRDERKRAERGKGENRENTPERRGERRGESG